MKQLAVYLLLAVTLSSCLKETIAGAMMKSETGGSGSSAISMSYQVNGVLVQTTVNEVTNQLSTYYRLSCTKTTNYSYVLSFVSTSGELTFQFYTDSLKTRNYVYSGSNGTEHFLDYNNTNGYTRYAADSMSFNVTSYTNSRISGNFSGRLTPSIGGGAPDTYGTPGSILITNGSFDNVPVFY